MTPNPCPICLDAVRTIFASACGHIFCEECLQTYSERFGKHVQSIPCPLCRTLILTRGFRILANCDKDLSNDDLYHHVIEWFESDASQSLILQDELVNAVREVLTRQDTTVRELLCLEDVAFSNVYTETILQGRRHFVLIDDVYVGFAMAWLYTRYH